METMNIPQQIHPRHEEAEMIPLKKLSVALPGLKLGQAANLMYGFLPPFDDNGAPSLPFYPPKSEPLNKVDATITPDSKQIWGFPKITLYPDTNSLLSAVFPYTVNPLAGDTSKFSLPSGPLMVEDLDRTAMMTKLSTYLGVDLAAGYSYMLVEIVRNNGSVVKNYISGSGGDPNDHLKPDALKSVQLLADVRADTIDNLSAKASAQFLTSFQQIGTHYVSKIDAGDRIFQVFAYKASAFAQVSAAFQKSANGKNYVGGVSAISFQYYTTPLNDNTGVELGYVSGLGTVNIVSGDPVFQKSLKDNLWEDQEKAGGNSIFMAYRQPTATVDLTTFGMIVPIGFEMTPIGNLIPVVKNHEGRVHWCRLFKGAMLQKYGQKVQVTFPTNNKYQWRNTIPNAGAWLSTIATPNVDVYDSHVALDGIQLTNRAAVKNFSSWSVVLESSSGNTKIPGDQVSLSSFLIDTSGPDTSPVIVLDNQKAFNNIVLACGCMDGAFTIGYEKGTERLTVMDGIMMGSASSSDVPTRSVVTINGDLFGVQSPQRLLAQTGNINFAIVSCQTLQYTRGDSAQDAQKIAHDCLVWLTDIIPNTDDIPDELARIRLRAAYFAHIAGNLNEEGVTVPYLTYSNYKDYIGAMTAAATSLNTTISTYQSQITAQRNAELAAKNAQEINDNVKISGNLLKNYINAVAANQGDIAANYESIINTKQSELSSAIASFGKLVQAVEDQKNAVEDAKIEFQFAMRDYETSEIIKAVINISTAFVTVGMTIVTPSSTISALKDLGETAQKIQKLINVLNKIMDLEKTIEGTVRNITKVNNTLDELKNVKLSMPSSMEWSEMSINFDASLAEAPSEVAGAKAKFSAAFKILVLRAQAMLAAQSKITQINADIALNKAQMQINADQKKRLDQITAGLNLGNTSQAPDLSEVDLLGLTGHVQSQLNQMLSSLAQALILQDSAVQFELLAQPTPITRFDLNSLQIVLANQQASVIQAKQAFNPPPQILKDPILITVKGVPISEFTGGSAYEFQIQPCVSAFQPYNMVRVQKVTVDIPSIKSSTNGRYRIDLTFKGDPFEDRDRYGDPLIFNTVARHFGPYEYIAATHKSVFDDQTGSIANDITRITPFSTWQVSMPNLPVNEGVDFGEEPFVDIVLSFKIEALSQPALNKFIQMQKLAVNTRSHGDMMNAMSIMMKTNAPMAKGGLEKTSLAAQADTPGTATLDNTLTQMNQTQGVLKGWDCVLNMLEAPVNKFLEEQYKAKYSTQKPMTVAVGFCQSFPAGPNSFHGYTKVSVDLGQPLLEFQANNHNFVKVTQVIQKGFTQSGSLMVNGKNVPCPIPLDLDNPAITWEDPVPIDLSNNPTLVGSVGLNMVQGVVDPPTLPDGTKGVKSDAHSVVLDFSTGSFVAKNLNIDTNNAELNAQLSNWFTTNPISYLINTVVFNDATTMKSLQPTKFKLNVLTTNSDKNILQVFITTNGVQQNNLTINVNEPIPDGFHNSLMINTKIMFSDIFVKNFNQGSSNLQVETVNPANDFDAWSARVKSGTVSGEATFKNTSTSETRISASGNTVTWALDGLTFKPTKDMGVALNYNAKKTVNFEHRTYNCYSGGGAVYCSWSGWGQHSVDVDVTLTGNYPLEVNNKDGKQEVQIASAPPNIDVTPPDLSPTGFCECNDNDLKIMVGQILKKEVPAKLQASMAGIQFTAVSVFALYNLLFPAQDFIVMKNAYIPGDLVVFGTFNKFVDEGA